MSDSLQPHRLHSPWSSPGQNTGVGSLSLLQGIFPIQGSVPGLPALQVGSLLAEPQGKPKNTGVGSLSLLHWIIPTQELNPGSPSLTGKGRVKIQKSWEFPGGPVVRTQGFHGQGPGSIPCQGTKILEALWHGQKTKNKKKKKRKKEKKSEGIRLRDFCFWDPMDCSLPGSSVHGIFQARMLE